LTFNAAAFSPVNSGTKGLSGGQQVVNNTFVILNGHWTADAEL
jgi:hypothetical protein